MREYYTIEEAAELLGYGINIAAIFRLMIPGNDAGVFLPPSAVLTDVDAVEIGGDGIPVKITGLCELDGRRGLKWREHDVQADMLIQYEPCAPPLHQRGDDPEPGPLLGKPVFPSHEWRIERKYVVSGLGPIPRGEIVVARDDLLFAKRKMGQGVPHELQPVFIAEDYAKARIAEGVHRTLVAVELCKRGVVYRKIGEILTDGSQEDSATEKRGRRLLEETAEGRAIIQARAAKRTRQP